MCPKAAKSSIQHALVDSGNLIPRLKHKFQYIMLYDSGKATNSQCQCQAKATSDSGSWHNWIKARVFAVSWGGVCKPPNVACLPATRCQISGLLVWRAWQTCLCRCDSAWPVPHVTGTGRKNWHPSDGFYTRKRKIDQIILTRSLFLIYIYK